MGTVNKIIIATLAQIINFIYASWFLFNCTGDVSKITKIKGCFMWKYDHVIARNIPMFKSHESILAAIIIGYSLYYLYPLLKGKELKSICKKFTVGTCVLLNIAIGGFLIFFSLAFGLDA